MTVIVVGSGTDCGEVLRVVSPVEAPWDVGKAVAVTVIVMGSLEAVEVPGEAVIVTVVASNEAAWATASQEKKKLLKALISEMLLHRCVRFSCILIADSALY